MPSDEEKKATPNRLTASSASHAVELIVEQVLKQVRSAKPNPTAEVQEKAGESWTPSAWSREFYRRFANESWLESGSLYSRNLGDLSAASRADAVQIAALQEHRKTRELISEKLSDLAQKQDLIEAKQEIISTLERRIEELTGDLARSRDLVASTKEICDRVRSEAEETRTALSREVADLQRYLSKFAPHRRFFKFTFGFFGFFLVSLIADQIFRVRIVTPFWNAVGIMITTAMLIVIYFGMKDVQSRPAETETQ
jgi:hypothetical protein